jgi:hypothetical protein
MIILPDQQRTPAWHAARIGLPTASRFDRILSDGTKRGEAKVERFARELAIESILGVSTDEASLGFMARGTDMESEARRFYEFQRDVQVVEVGLCLTDDRRCGASPDGLIDPDGVLEIKIPAAATHCEYVLDPGELYAAYRIQCQGLLFVTERTWLDLMSYHPIMPPVIYSVARDQELICRLVGALTDLHEKLDEMKAKLLASGCKTK